MHSPIFFLSSTIHDFRDLRSALKYYLEQQGCVVRASEFNDFPKPIDVHSYRACLDAIGGSDYFVLLVGGRVGGRVSGTDSPSITQEEYREAYRLHKEGRLKLLLFVRDEIWALRDDRAQLEKHLLKEGVPQEIRDQAQASNPKVVEDARFLIAFIDEITRANEAREAAKGGGSAPTGNWVHTFRTFADVVDVLQVQAFAARPVDEAALRVLLVRELSALLQASLGKFDTLVTGPRRYLDDLRRLSDLPTEFSDGEQVRLDPKAWRLLSTVALTLLAWRFETPVLNGALAGATFLEFDRKSETLRETALFGLLSNLRDQVDRLRIAHSNEGLQMVFRYSPKALGGKDQPVYVESRELFMFLHLMDRWANVIELASASIVALRSDQVLEVKLYGHSPLEGKSEELAAEKATPADIEQVLADFIAGRARA